MRHSQIGGHLVLSIVWVIEPNSNSFCFYVYFLFRLIYYTMMQEEGDIMRTTKRPRNEANVANNSSISKTSNIEFRRSFNHIEGNWPTFVYIPVRGSNSVQRLLSICIDHFLCVHQLLEDSICREATPHISLSRTLTLRFHQIDAFVATLRRSLQSMTR